MAMSKKNHNALSSSFMFLSFITAALLMAVQSFGTFAQPAARSSVQPKAAAQNLEVNQAAAPSKAASTQMAVLKPGMSDVLASLQPVALIRQSELVVELSKRQVSLYQNGALQVSYEIAVGKEGWETPAGEFHILNMQENPLWQNPLTGETVSRGADNPLGSRWIGFWTDGTHQIGFHGTDQEDLIGQAVSHGCIRLRDRDIQVLYNQVAIGTPVVVKP